MRREKTSAKWVEMGYNLFAHDGLEGIQVEKIARALGLNKSSFYHFFGTLEVFQEQLILHHYDMVNLAMKDGKGAENLDPDFLTRMVNHKVTFMVQVQLIRNKSVPSFSKAYLQVNKQIDESVIVLWNKYLGVFDNDNFSLLCLSFVRDTFYSRVSFETFDYNFLHELAIEAKKVVNKIKEGQTPLNRSQSDIGSKRSRLEPE